MTKKPKPKKKVEIQDEPGAEERFEDLVKRGFATPPSKKTAGSRRKPSAKGKKG